jgi:hypothetical protein
MVRKSNIFFVGVFILIMLLPSRSHAQIECENEISLNATVDNSNPFVGEQIIYTLRIINSTSLQPSPVVPTSFERFWLGGALDVQRFQEPGCGATVGVTVIERVLFPLEAGTVTIPPGGLDFTSNPVYDPTTRIVSNGVDVNIQPLPENAPPSFTGAVGVFPIIEASLSQNTINQGEPVRLVVIVEGAGNIDQVDPPELKLEDHWRVYPQAPQSFVGIEDGGRLYGGTKRFEWLISPSESGNLVVPPVELGYFNPSIGAYQTVSTTPIALNVIPVEFDTSPELDIQPVVLPDDNQWQLKPLAVVSPRWSRPLSPIWLALPLLIVVSAEVWRRYQIRMKRLAKQRRRDFALRHSRSRLAQAARSKEERGLILLRNAILGYFADKWNMDARNVDPQVIQDRLIQIGIREDNIETILDCVAFSQEQRFAPGESVSLAPVARVALQALTEIDREMVASS